MRNFAARTGWLDTWNRESSIFAIWRNYPLAEFFSVMNEATGDVALVAKNRPFGICYQLTNDLMPWKSGIIVGLLGCGKCHTDQSAL